MKFQFKPLTKQDLPILKKWFKKPHIARFWHGKGLKNTFKTIDDFFIGIEKSTDLWIVWHNDQRVGYFMAYRIQRCDLLYQPYLFGEAKAITIDHLIGNMDYLGKGYASSMIIQFLKQCYDKCTDCFIDPAVDNHKAIHVYEKAGFTKLKTFMPSWDDTKCQLMQKKLTISNQAVN